MVAIVLVPAAVVLLMGIAYVAGGYGAAWFVASTFIKLLVGAVILIVLALVVGLGYILLCTPSSPFLI